MNFDETNNEQTPAAESGRPVAFCQNCGKPLDEQTVRVVGPAVYCEPCLAAKLAGTPVSGPAAGTASAGTGAGAAWQWNVNANWIPPTGPNPGLAGLLGLIPGVGAMYNEQYAKGIFHLIVFAVLISLSHSSDLFGFLAAGWIFYMVIEAHHTARARRDGTVLPNPFGLNDLGERLGFGKAWPAAAVPAAAVPGADTATTQAYPPPPSAGFTQGPTPAYSTGYEQVTAPPAAAWGSPVEAMYDPGAAYATAGYTSNPYTQAYTPGYGGGYPPPIPPVPPFPPYGTPYAPVPPVGAAEAPFVPKPSRFPAGAIWLIGLGTIFLLSTTGVFQTLFGWSLVGFVLIGLAVWIFLRRMMDTGATLGNDGSAGYMLRVVRALWASVWVFTVGLLLLLNEFDVVPWHRSWPLFIILAGVMGLLQRAAYSSAAANSYAATPYGTPTPAPTAPASNTYSIVPTSPEPLRSETSSHEGEL